MSRITFLIGNGFDINAGLDTRYSDFYEYYFNQYPDDMLAKSIRDDYDFLSDLEIGLGKYTKDIAESEEDMFFDSKDVMESALADYLEEQQNRIQITGEKVESVVKEIQNSVLHFYEGFPNVQYEDIKNVIACTSERITYSFISFNYTDNVNYFRDFYDWFKTEEDIELRGIRENPDYKNPKLNCVRTVFGKNDKGIFQLEVWMKVYSSSVNIPEYSCAVTPQVRQTGNRLSGLAGTAYASLLA